ncbi:ELMO/CED-12 family protein [Toxoplasma gondii MAS]|uniref:ELMO/CED-12 family protein n=1 Tax=Toxoplasma gondii MAS TaxID=943118 RepID=A0A086QL38_TOXGO|nr:ELMO/CED-12 family protein [Toxoplasma gondii MAS]
MDFVSVVASLRAFVRRLYMVVVNVVMSLITGMSELELLLSRYPFFSADHKPSALTDKTVPHESPSDGPETCRLALARQLVEIEEFLRTRSSSTGIEAGLYSSTLPVEDLCQLICAECSVRSPAHRAHLVDILRRIRRKQEAAVSIKARASEHFDPTCSENHRRLEHIWRLFFEKPLPPSFHCCSSFVGKPERRRQVSSTKSSSLHACSSSTTVLYSSSPSCAFPSFETHVPTSAAVCSGERGLVCLSQSENSVSPRGSSSEPARAALPGKDWKSVSSMPSTDKVESSRLSSSVEASFEGQESSWGELGFQHPLHDFRGAGCLGADCLLFLGQRFPEVAQRLLQDSHDEQFWMPFAATSINVVGWLLDMMDRRLLDVFLFACDETSFAADSAFEKVSKTSKFYSLTKQSDAHAASEDLTQDMEKPAETVDALAVPEVFFVLYAAVFTKFCQFWRSRQPENILQFGMVSMDFRERLKQAFKEFVSGREGGNMSAWEYFLESGVPEKRGRIYHTSEEVLHDIRACVEDRLHVTGNGKESVQSSPRRQEGTSPVNARRQTENCRLLRLVNAHMET